MAKKPRKAKPLAPGAMRPLAPHEWTKQDDEWMATIVAMDQEARAVVALRGRSRMRFQLLVARVCQLDAEMAKDLLRMIKDGMMFRARRAKEDQGFQSVLSGIVKATSKRKRRQG